MSSLLLWLCMMPWASAVEVEQVMRVSRATVNRGLERLYKGALIVSRTVGRRGRATRRWIPTSAGLRQVFAFDHVHRGPWVDDHEHAPISPDRSRHQHLPWWLAEAGIRELYQRLEQLEAIYEVAPNLFRGAGREWLYGAAEAPLEELRFLRRGQLVEAIGTYQGGIEIAFCWIGRQLRPRRLREKWVHRFSHEYLEWTSEARELERRRDWFIDQIDPDYDPTPHLAGYVCIGPDEWAMRQAMELLPLCGYAKEYAWSWWVAGRRLWQAGQHGLVTPNQDRVFDRFEVVRLGEPERLAIPTGGRDAPPEPAALSRVLCNRLLGLSEEWDAMSEEDFVALSEDFRGPVSSALADLVNEGLLAPVDDVYYLTDPAMKYVADRDRVSIATVRRRISSYLNPEGARHGHQLQHNRGVLQVVRILKAHGIPVYGGWRGVVNLEGRTQVQPDGVLYADGALGRGKYFVEFERSATTPEEVLDKWSPYRKAADGGNHLRCIWVCETRQAARRFLGMSRGLPAMVATLDQLRAGPLSGPGAIWQSTHGQELGLSPIGGGWV